MNITITIPDEIVQATHLTLLKMKQEIIGLFWKKHNVTLEQSFKIADLTSDELQELAAAIQEVERTRTLIKEKKLITLSHFEWERFRELQDNPPQPNHKLKKLMQKKSLISYV